MKNNNREEDKKDNAKKTSVEFLDFLDPNLIEIPIQIGKTIAGAIGDKIESVSKLADTNILENVSGALTSTAETIGEHAGDIIEGIAKTAGNVAGGVGDVLSNIDIDIDL